MPRIKICGLMNYADIQLCALAGADAIGLVVDYPLAVPWNLTRREAGKLIGRAPPFVNTCVVTGGTTENILAVAKEVQPDIIQLHFQETLAEVDFLARQLNTWGIKTIKALSIDGEGKCCFEIPDPAEAARALAKTNIAALLVDSYHRSRPGGTGIPVNPAIFKTVQQTVALPVIMAGGLNPANVLHLINTANPYAVDVLTGVETSPGHKDPDLVDRFIQSVKAYDSCEAYNRPESLKFNRGRRAKGGN